MHSESDPNIASIRRSFETLLAYFSVGNSDGVAKHIQFPALNINAQTTAFHTKEEFIDFVDSYPLQEDYSYTKADKVNIYRIGGPIYCLDYDYSRFNDSDGLLSQGRGIYFYSNETGHWKVFSFWNGDRETEVEL
tara:strand:- start:774 stop:1178 length:405 start_codon:yes stop_codon:yes gene_type:complete